MIHLIGISMKNTHKFFLASLGIVIMPTINLYSLPALNSFTDYMVGTELLVYQCMIFGWLSDINVQ